MPFVCATRASGPRTMTRRCQRQPNHFAPSILHALVSAVDVAHAIAAILDDPGPHIGQIYNLTGFESADLNHYARAFSEALGRRISYRSVPLAAWIEALR